MISVRQFNIQFVSEIKNPVVIFIDHFEAAFSCGFFEKFLSVEKNQLLFVFPIRHGCHGIVNEFIRQELIAFSDI